MIVASRIKWRTSSVDYSSEDEKHARMEVEARLNNDDVDTRESSGRIWYFAGACSRDVLRHPL